MAPGFIRPAGSLNADSTSRASANRHRELGGSGDGGYLVDDAGDALAVSSLSWRYLGVFLDNCNGNGRNLGDNDNSNYSCRKVLWAAYHDPGYQGEGIAEYKFYQRRTGGWDSSTCRSRTYGLYSPFTRCQPLNCHEARTNLELVGVFKQTDGLYDFTEQLFKHQGYCLWDADKQDSGDSGDSGDSADDETSSDYEFMTNLSENWVYGCTQLEDLVDDYGNSLYYDTKPLPGGDMTYGVYTDSSCLIESSLTWSDVLSAASNNGSNDEDGMPSIASLERWNTLLGDYKICQPCRAYNRVKTSDGSSSSNDNSDRSEDSGDYEDGDDGEGGKDRHGFNCYDDAGYQNCNQCYKFQTQTDMEQATNDDLERATRQGTILAVTVDGTRYGKSHYVAPGRGLRAVKKTSIALSSLLGLGLFGYIYYMKKGRRKVGVGSDDSLEDHLNADGKSVKRKNNDEPGWASYIKTAPKRMYWAAASCCDEMRSTYLPSTTNEEMSDADAPTTRNKKNLKKQLRKATAQLAAQEIILQDSAILIQELQQRLAYYESKDNNITSAIAVAEMEESKVDTCGGEENSEQPPASLGDEFKLNLA